KPVWSGPALTTGGGSARAPGAAFRTSDAQLLPMRPSPSTTRKDGWRYVPPMMNSERLAPLDPVAEDVSLTQVIFGCAGKVAVPAPVVPRSKVVVKPFEKVSVPVPGKPEPEALAFWMVTEEALTGKGKWTV